MKWYENTVYFNPNLNLKSNPNPNPNPNPSLNLKSNHNPNPTNPNPNPNLKSKPNPNSTPNLYMYINNNRIKKVIWKYSVLQGVYMYVNNRIKKYVKTMFPVCLSFLYFKYISNFFFIFFSERLHWTFWLLLLLLLLLLLFWVSPFVVCGECFVWRIFYGELFEEFLLCRIFTENWIDFFVWKSFYLARVCYASLSPFKHRF